jgi:hypothetical protein
VGGLFDSDGRKENRNLFAVRLLFTETVSRVFPMTQTTAERTAQANLTIQELISAMAEVQKLIASHDKDCHLGLITGEKLGTAYYRLAEKLTQALLFC